MNQSLRHILGGPVPISAISGLGHFRCPRARAAFMTVWVYVDTSEEVEDADHLKVFANEDVADAWFRDNDPEGISHHPIRAAASSVMRRKLRPLCHDSDQAHAASAICRGRRRGP